MGCLWDNHMQNPLIDIQQVTYLIFIKMLDDNQIKQERKYNDMKAHGIDVAIDENTLTFKNGNYVDEKNNINVPYKNLRWSVFKEFESRSMFENVRDNVFPFIKSLHGERQTAFTNFMKNALFEIDSPYILSKMVEMLSDETLGFNNKDMMGDCYEYLLSKMAVNGDAGLFRTPRHIIDMMIEIANPTLKDNIIDPAMGSAGFLTESAKFIKEHYEKELMNKENNNHFHNTMFTGFDTDSGMLRIGCMNMTLHGVENPTIRYNDSLGEEYGEANKYSLVLANPPFSGTFNASLVAPSLNQISGGTQKTELLFLSLFLRLLSAGGRCVSIIPVGVLNNTNEKAYTRLRKALVEEQKLEVIIYMPSGIFEPYSGVQTGILVFTKTNSGGTDKVWLYNMEADGYSLDKKRTPVDANDIPDVVARWKNLAEEVNRTRYEKSFFVDKQDIVDNDYVFSFNKYQLRKIEKKTYTPTSELLKSINELEREFKLIMEEINVLG